LFCVGGEKKKTGVCMLGPGKKEKKVAGKKGGERDGPPFRAEEGCGKKGGVSPWKKKEKREREISKKKKKEGVAHSS